MEGLSELRIAIANRNGLRYEPELKERIRRFVGVQRAVGRTWKQLSEGLGVPSGTLTRWAESAGESTAALLPVRAVSDAGDERVSITSPSGWRIEGLSVAQAVSLVGSLER